MDLHDPVVDRVQTTGTGTRPSRVPFAAVFRTMREAVLVCSGSGRIVAVNPAAERMFGLSADDLVGRIHGEGRTPRATRRRLDHVRRHLADHAEWEGDIPFVRGDGARRTSRCRASLLCEDDARPSGFVVVMRDVTEENETVVRLAESERLWRLTLDCAPIGIALVGLDGGWLHVNAALCRMLGHTEPELRRLTFQELGHPDELDETLTVSAALLTQAADHVTGERRYRHADGRFVWVRMSAALAWGENGDPLHYIYQLEDITERRMAAQQLAGVVRSASDAFVRLDADGRVLDWNAAATDMFGWSRQEALGALLGELVQGPDGEGGQLARAGSPAGDEAKRSERRLRRRDGSSFPVEVALWQTEDAPGELFALVRDISERVRAEEESQARASRQAAIVAAQLDIAQVELTPTKVMQLICDRAVQLTGAGGAAIERRDGDDLVYRAAAGEQRDQLGLRVPVEGSFSGLALRTGQPLLSHDCLSDPRVHAGLARRTGVRSMVVIPLRHKGGTVGVLKALSPVPGQFTEDDLGVLDLLAAPFATAMFNAWNLERTSQRASTDRLTGLANRAQVLKELDRAIARQARRGGHTAVVFLDLDGFKQVNDTLGHVAGDELLTAVAGRLRQAVRTTDTPGRYGGDEFIVVCDQMTNADDALVLADRLVETVAGQYPLAAGLASVGASIGVAVALEPVTAAAMLTAADEAMYEAKHAGGNGYRIRDLVPAAAGR